MNFADDPLPRMTSFKKSTELSPQELFRPQPITLPQGLIIENIELLSVSQKMLLISTFQNELYRVTLPRLQNFEEITYPQEFFMDRIFLSPIGDHCFLRLKQQKLGYVYFYLHGSQKRIEMSWKLEFTSKAIESVGWSSRATDKNSKEVLLGTSDGWILLTEFDATKKGNEVRSDLKMLINLEACGPIEGIQFDYTTPLSPGAKPDLYIMAVTKNECYQFTAPGYHEFQQLIELYKEKENRHMIIKGTKSFPNSKKNRQLLKFLKNEDNVVHKALWLYSSGFFIAEFPHGLELFKIWKKFDFDKDPELVPREVIITDFHVVLQFPNGLHKVFSTIVEQYIHSFTVQNPKALAYEWQNQSLYIVADHAKLYNIPLEREKSSVWKLLIDKEKYEEAFNSVTGDTQSYVAGLCGDYFFKEKMCTRSIGYYLKSDRSFEEVVLKFLDS